MVRGVHLTVLLALCAAGCAGRPAATSGREATIFVPGVFGDGGWYDGLCRAVAEKHNAPEVVTWGAPKPFFVANFSNPGIHQDAEQKLAARIDALPPDIRTIRLIGHSAGCGVVLGALSQSQRTVSDVVLIAPSVSPTYPIAASASHVSGNIHVFVSSLDTVFLKWRTGNFGTYDAVRTPAAGYAGFAKPLPPRVVEHQYDESWKALGNDGGHMGGVAEAFVRAQVLPLLGHDDQAR
jgi:pimeloyl-ACP methyl ester carboxylesterase